MGSRVMFDLSRLSVFERFRVALCVVFGLPWAVEGRKYLTRIGS